LESLRRSASTSRVLNLCSVFERHGALEEYQTRPMFRSPRLNRSIIVKHTLRPSERAELVTSRAAATKIIIPFSQLDLRLGGGSVFIEQDTAERALRSTLGLTEHSADFHEDMAVLRLLATLPSLDPFLLRERLASSGHHVARCYFDISDADAAMMRSHVAQEIGQLVTLAFAKSADAAELSAKMAEKLLRDDTAEALGPLRQTLRLTAGEYEEGIFAWKGFLYYKWVLGKLAPKLRPVAEEILKTRLVRITSDEASFVNNMRRRIVDGIGRHAHQAKAALGSYDSAYSQLIERGDGSGFRGFLLHAPKTFVVVGDVLGVLSHIVSFWRYRYPERAALTIEGEDAMDLFGSFDSSLGARLGDAEAA
jgi:hypothetical protein